MIHFNRLEAIDVKSPRGLAKIVGTVLSLTGALVMILYKGHTIQSLKGAPFHLGGEIAHNNWIKGTILTVVSCISWSLWYILQVYSSIIKYTYTFYFLFFNVSMMKNLGPDCMWLEYRAFVNKADEDRAVYILNSVNWILIL